MVWLRREITFVDVTRVALRTPEQHHERRAETSNLVKRDYVSVHVHAGRELICYKPLTSRRQIKFTHLMALWVSTG
jgi:hypothetical protein